MVEAVTTPESQEQEKASGAQDKSWGDRFKKSVFNQGVYVGLNFVVNASASAALAYVIERRYKAGISERVDKTTKALAKFLNLDKGKFLGIIDEGRARSGVKWSFDSVSLGIAGNGLVPVIKKLEDHRQNIQFRIGHKLDQLQEKLGKGNEASRRNLADYEKVREAMLSPGSVTFSAEEKDRLHAKYRLDIAGDSQKASFTEHRLSWLKVIAARIMGLVVTDGIFAPLIGSTLQGDTHKNFFSSKIEKGLKATVPGYKLLDNAKPVEGLSSGARHYAELLYIDTVLTGVSSATHKVVQSILHKDPDAKTLHAGRMPEKPKDFRAREEDNRASQDQQQLSAIG